MAQQRGGEVNLPPVKKDININTIISVVGFVIMIGGLVWNAAIFKASVDDMARKYDGWIAQHETYHKDRLAFVSASEARVDTRLSSLETAIRKQDNLEYRMTVQEQGSANLAKSVEELKASISSLGTDIRVIREIITRLDTVKPEP